MASQTKRASRIAMACAGAGFITAISLAGAASAQTMNANSASFNAGFGRAAGEENRAVEVGLTDANGATTLSSGLIQAPAGSLFAEVTGVVNAAPVANTTDSSSSSSNSGGSMGGGVGENFSGAGGGASATTIGHLNVTVQGAQTHAGAATATSSTNGK